MMSPPKATWRHGIAVAAIALHALSALAEPPTDYPSRPIRIIVPSAPNGAGDVIARELGDRLGVALRIPVVVENRAGASGVIGNDIAAHSAADGYTLLFATSATHVIAAHLISHLPYDPLSDFVPIINAGYATSVIVVNATLPVHTVGEFVAYARARPGRLNYASSGVGSANHLDTEVFAAIAGIKLVHIPYRGTADGYRALIAGDVQLMIGAITSALPHVSSGKVRVLAVMTDRRSPLLPDVPTIAQAGLENVDVRKWFGFLAPAGTPREIVSRLNRAFDAILHEPEMRAWMDHRGFELAGGSPQAFDDVVRADFARWGETVRQLGLRPE
jgi:tripartite-type tricarboxylate transporter receptor subunit TctC